MQERHLAVIFGNCKANYVVEEPVPAAILQGKVDYNDYEVLKEHKLYRHKIKLFDYWVDVKNSGDQPWNTYSVTLRDATGSILDISKEENYTADEAKEEALRYWNCLEEKDKMLKSVTKTNPLNLIAVTAEAELVYPSWVKA